MSSFDIRTILVPLDFSKTSLYALDHAVQLASLYGAGIRLMHAVESVPVISERGYFNAMEYAAEFERGMIRESDRHLERIAERIRKKTKGKVDTTTVVGRTHTAIRRLAKKFKAEIIVMGTHGVSGFREFFIGSNAFRVVHDAECPVLTVSRASRKPGFSNILVPFRDKPHSREKVDYAISLGRKYHAAIHILAIDTENTKSKKRKLQLEADQILRFVQNAGLRGTIKVMGGLYHAESILPYARKKKCDLIVSMSDTEKTDISEYFKGPYAQQIINHSPIPVLSIRPRFNPDMINQRFY